MTDEKTTHFGYETVAVEDKASKVADVFHSVAAKYDIMNDLMSFGVHRLWKRITIDMSGVRPGNSVLDLAGGTGDLTRKFSRIVGPQGKVVLADINSSMLNVGRDRLTDQGYVGNIEYVQANAECLPFEDNSFHCITIAFGLRNITDKDAALRSMLRVLKPGGRLMVLEFSQIPNDLMQWAYDLYSFNIIPRMGQVIAQDRDSYQYLVESIRRFPDQDTFLDMVKGAGFENAKYRNLTMGVACLHSGWKI